MKIIHITNNYPTDKHPAFGIFVKEQIASISEMGIINDVLFINTREKSKFEYLKAIFRIFLRLIRTQYDLVHCHHAFSGFICLLSGISLFKKKIVSYQGTPDIEGGPLLFKLLTVFFNAIILKANFPNYSHSKVSYLPNGTNFTFFHPTDSKKCKLKLGLDVNTRYILFMDSYVGRPYKRIDRFYAVMKKLREEHGMQDIQEMVLTNTERDQIPNYINAADLHLLTSDVEGSPNSVKECLACNTSVVSTPVGNVKELLDGVIGSFVSSTFDVSELAKLAANSLTQKLDVNGRVQLESKGYKLEEVAKKIIKIYFSLK